MDKACLQVIGGTRGFHLNNSRNQLLKEDTKLHPRQYVTETHMWAQPKGQMFVGLSIHSKDLRHIENVFVSIC